MPLQTTIPIRNIYCMLCYYWKDDFLKSEVEVGEEDFKDIYNLMANVLVMSLQPIIKRGFCKKYVRCEESTLVPKGKILMNDSIAEKALNKRQLVCERDDFSSNIKFNQIIRFTLDYLINYEGLDEKLKESAIGCRRYFDNVDHVRVVPEDFKSMSFDRSNRYYVMAMNVCKLVSQCSVANSGDGNRYPELSDTKILSKIYEEFIYNYCNMKFTDCTVGRERIGWNLADGSVDSSLPKMNTDMTLTNKKSKTRLIVDAKFYTSMFEGRYEGYETFISSNLYQIYAYMNNHSSDGCSNDGMLLYPQTGGEPVSKTYKFRDGKKLYIKSIDLGAEWESVEDTLNGIRSIVQGSTVV